AHGRGGHGAGVGAHARIVDPLLGPEEEELVAVGVELAGDGTADVVAELVERVVRGLAVLLGERAGVPAPGVRVEAGVAVELEDVGPEVASPALGHEPDLAAGSAPVLREVAGGQDL